jgi:hypothetical protein
MKSRQGYRHGIGWISAALGLCLLTVLSIRFVSPRSAETPLIPTALRRPLPPGATPAARALWEAQGWRLQAFLAADAEREALEASDPGPLTSVEREASRRRRLIAADRAGHLARARDAARRSAALARTPDEVTRAAALRARLECYAGHHQVELQQARRLVKLAPRMPESWMALRRAGRCAGQEALVRQADAKMAALAGPVAMRYPPAAFRHDGWDMETPALAYDPWDSE